MDEGQLWLGDFPEHWRWIIKNDFLMTARALLTVQPAVSPGRLCSVVWNDLVERARRPNSSPIDCLEVLAAIRVDPGGARAFAAHCLKEAHP